VALPRRAITVIPTVSITQAEAGPPIPKYRVHLDQGGFYRFAVGDVLTPDDVTVIGGTGGTGGNWLLVRDDDAGANLTDANATIQVGGKRWRTLPAATLTANRTLKLSLRCRSRLGTGSAPTSTARTGYPGQAALSSLSFTSFSFIVGASPSRRTAENRFRNASISHGQGRA
jgi:hypothetical protein